MDSTCILSTSPCSILDTRAWLTFMARATSAWVRRAACASGPGGSRRRGRGGHRGRRPGGRDHLYQGRRGAARREWCPTGSAGSSDLLGRCGEKAGVAVLGELDGVAVPAGPVPRLVPGYQQDGLALRVEDEQDPDLGPPRGPGADTFGSVRPR